MNSKRQAGARYRYFIAHLLTEKFDKIYEDRPVVASIGFFIICGLLILMYAAPYMYQAYRSYSARHIISSVQAPKQIVSTYETSPISSSESAVDMHGDITAPAEGYVPWTPTWVGFVDNPPDDDRSVFLSIENSDRDLYMYKTHAIKGKFNFPHHLGNRDTDIGADFVVRLFVPAPGARVDEGHQPFTPAGQFVTPVKHYIRRANRLGEE